jgi:hypothetical protein
MKGILITALAEEILAQSPTAKIREIISSIL